MQIRSLAADPDTHVTTLANGVRVLTLALPGRATVNVTVFVRTGSQHESRRQNGISHVVEHMAFKGTEARNCQEINLDAEQLGAEVNAHTDKDHTAFHIEGLVRDSAEFIRMLADIVLRSTFPDDELERERQVILHEVTEDEEDSLSTAYKLFDQACYGEHPIAQPVIGQRRNIRRFTRDELLGYVERQYTAGNVIVGVAGDVDPAQIKRWVDAAFGALPRGSDNTVTPPVYGGGFKLRRLTGCAQTHLVLGFPMPSVHGDHPPYVMAAALFGEGMSSPLLDQLRERRGLAYHASCSADLMESCGQFVIEASTAPEQLLELVSEVSRLLAAQADAIDETRLQRALNQLTVRSLRDRERPARRLEAAALDLFMHGAVRTTAMGLARLQAVTAADARRAFQSLLIATPAVALTGRIGKGAEERVQASLVRLGTRLQAAA